MHDKDGQAQQNGNRRAERRACRDPEDGRRDHWDAEHDLICRPRDGERCADENRADDARQTQLHHDLSTAVHRRCKPHPAEARREHIGGTNGVASEEGGHADERDEQEQQDGELILR